MFRWLFKRLKKTPQAEQPETKGMGSTYAAHANKRYNEEAQAASDQAAE